MSSMTGWRKIPRCTFTVKMVTHMEMPQEQILFAVGAGLISQHPAEVSFNILVKLTLGLV